jgi:hypothetical protein
MTKFALPTLQLRWPAWERCGWAHAKRGRPSSQTGLAGFSRSDDDKASAASARALGIPQAMGLLFCAVCMSLAVATRIRDLIETSRALGRAAK